MARINSNFLAPAPMLVADSDDDAEAVSGIQPAHAQGGGQVLPAANIFGGLSPHTLADTESDQMSSGSNNGESDVKAESMSEHDGGRPDSDDPIGGASDSAIVNRCDVSVRAVATHQFMQQTQTDKPNLNPTGQYLRIGTQ